MSTTQASSLADNPFFITLETYCGWTGKNLDTLKNILTSKKSRDDSRKRALPPFKRVAPAKYAITVKDFDLWLATQPIVNAPTPRRGRPTKAYQR